MSDSGASHDEEPNREDDHRPEPEPEPATYNERIEILPGDPRVAYRPGVVVVDDDANDRVSELTGIDSSPIFEEEPPFGQWHKFEGVPDAPALVDLLVSEGLKAQLDIIYFANGVADECCGTCPPHPAAAIAIAANPWAANPWAANPWAANPWAANPWAANPWAANPWAANPWAANPEALNIVATGKPPTTSVMPADGREFGDRPTPPCNEVAIGVLDSGIAGGPDNQDGQRPPLLEDLDRIWGEQDEPSRAMGSHPADDYLDPVAGHGTFIAGLIEQLTPGCKINVRSVFKPEGDVSVTEIAPALVAMMTTNEPPIVKPDIVNLSFGGTGRDEMLEVVIRYYHGGGTVFVASAGNEGTCVEQYPAAMPEVVSVGALGPNGPAPWSNYGSWVDASAPGSNLVSAFFRDFNGAHPPINGMDIDEFNEWATWSGTSFAGPVVVAALANNLATMGGKPRDAVARLIRAPHLARFPGMGTIVNF